MQSKDKEEIIDNITHFHALLLEKEAQLNIKIDQLSKDIAHVKYKILETELYSQELSQELSSVYASKSWAVTRPLRQFSLFVSNFLPTLKFQINTLSQRFIIRPLASLINKFPWIRERIVNFIDRYPPLSSRLRVLYHNKNPLLYIPTPSQNTTPQKKYRSRLIYYWVDHTIQFPKNTGIERVCRQLAKAMMESGLSLIPVKRDQHGKFMPANITDLEYFSKWNGPAPLMWHEWVPPTTVQKNSWLLIPEMNAHWSVQERQQLMAYFDQLGLKTAIIFYDAIPWKLKNIYPNHYQIHKEYMMSLADYDLVLPISHFAKADLEQFLEQTPHQKIKARIIANPLPGQFPDVPRVTQTEMNKTGPFKIVCIGSIEPRKNHKHLLEAFAKVQKMGLNIELTIVGKPISVLDPSLGPYIHQFIKEHSGVTWEDDADDERISQLLKACDFTVYPSIEEGFGLPILESLWHAKPCICANFGVMAEVAAEGGCLAINVLDTKAIADGIVQLVKDDHLRQTLVNEATTRSFKSWQDYAKETITLINNQRNTKLKLAYVSPLPPEKSGIADYSAGLLPELAKYFDIELITDLNTIEASEIEQAFPKKSISQFYECANDYDQIFYHFGNSHFHDHMFAMLESFPGVVVMHDFFYSHALYIMGKTHNTDIFQKNLYESHGPEALKYLYHNGIKKTLSHYPVNSIIFKNATGIIVHSQHALDLARQWYGESLANHISYIKLSRAEPKEIDKAKSRQILGIKGDDFVVCCFGIMGIYKQNEKLLGAWFQSALAKNKNCYLFFVGACPDVAYKHQLKKLIDSFSDNQRVIITGFIDADTYHHYLTAADLGVQLRKNSHGESSISVLDCLSHRIPTIVNACGSFAEIADTAVYMIPENAPVEQLTESIEEIFGNPPLREKLQIEGYAYYKNNHTPQILANEYAQAIKLYTDNPINFQKLMLEAPLEKSQEEQKNVPA